jgi:hypothetical protein
MNQKIKETISNAFAHCIALNIYDSKNRTTLPENIKKYYQKKINPNSIQDKELVKNTEMYDFINWNITERNKVIRILARDIDLLERIDIKNYNFSISELFPLFLRYPELIKQLVLDFSKLSPLEAIKILECNEDLIEEIDITNYTFSKKDMLEIISKFRDSEKVMERLDLTVLDHYSTRNLISKTGIDYIDRVNLNLLKPIDWLDILEQQPDLIDFCNLNIFIINDCYLLTKLVILFPNLSHLIEENKSKISALGWENLINEDLEKYQDICAWEKFTEKNWNSILNKNPHLINIKQRFFFF